MFDGVKVLIKKLFINRKGNILHEPEVHVGKSSSMAIRSGYIVYLDQAPEP